MIDITSCWLIGAMFNKVKFGVKEVLMPTIVFHDRFMQIGKIKSFILREALIDGKGQKTKMQNRYLVEN
jgi:hypothetical protein